MILWLFGLMMAMVVPVFLFFFLPRGFGVAVQLIVLALAVLILGDKISLLLSFWKANPGRLEAFLYSTEINTTRGGPGA